MRITDLININSIELNGVASGKKEVITEFLENNL